MKMKYLLIFGFVLLTMNSFCQKPSNFTIDFEDDSWKNYITFDTTGDTNIWTIGKPNGIVFSKAWEGENALFTNLNGVSKTPNKSAFIITVPVDTFKLHFGTFAFYFNANTANMNNLIIEYSVDGHNFYNTLEQWAKWNWGYKNMSSHQDSLMTIPPINDTMSGWIHARLNFFYLPPTTDLAPYDTFTLTFTYNADTLTSNEGIIIDSISCNLYSVSTQESDFLQEHVVFPNPATNKIYISQSNSQPKTGVYKIYTIQGEELIRGNCEVFVTEIDIQTFVDGIYILQLNLGNQIFTERFIKF